MQPGFSSIGDEEDGDCVPMSKLVAVLAYPDIVIGGGIGEGRGGTHVLDLATMRACLRQALQRQIS